MLTREDAMCYIAAILTSLREIDRPAPESAVYGGLGWDIHRYEDVKMLLLDAKLVKVEGYQMSLTPFGRETAEKLQAVLDKSNNKAKTN